MPVSTQRFTLSTFDSAQTIGERAQDESGFTVIELVVAMLILMIALTSFSVMFVNMQSASNGVVSDTALQTEARSGVDRMISEFRQAYTAQSAVAPVITMTSTQLTFYVPDESQPYHLLKVGYRLNGNTLQRGFERSTNTGGPPWSWPSPDALSGGDHRRVGDRQPRQHCVVPVHQGGQRERQREPRDPTQLDLGHHPGGCELDPGHGHDQGTGPGAAPYTYSAIGTIRGTAFDN